MNQEDQIQRIVDDINDALLYDDEAWLTLFDVTVLLGSVGVLGASNIGRELLEDRVEQFTACLSQTLGRGVGLDDSLSMLERYRHD